MKLSWSRRALYGVCIAIGLMTTSALAIDTKSSTADHTQFKELTGPFASGPEVTGFNIHGTYNLLWFSKAAQLHNWAAYALIGLWVLAIFWHFTTEQWRQYLPTSKQLGAVIHYYVIGTFTGAEHPFRPTTDAKHNPLQRLAYLWFKLMISPLIWISGLLYLFYGQRHELGYAHISLEYIVLTHTAAAYMMLVFLIAHVYMGTMGKSVFSLLKPMLTGYEVKERKD